MQVSAIKTRNATICDEQLSLAFDRASRIHIGGHTLEYDLWFRVKTHKSLNNGLGLIEI